MNVLRRILRSKIATIVLVILITVSVFHSIRILYITYETESQIAKLRSQIEDHKKQQEKLLNLQKFLQSDFFAEREARIKLGMKKPGEFVAVLPPIEKSNANEESFNSSDTKDSADQQIRTSIKNSTHWWNYFFSKK